MIILKLKASIVHSFWLKIYRNGKLIIITLNGIKSQTLANSKMFVPDEMNLPADIPSYLSSQGTLSEPQEGYSNSENGSHQQLMPSHANGYAHKGTDGTSCLGLLCFLHLHIYLLCLYINRLQIKYIKLLYKCCMYQI